MSKELLYRKLKRLKAIALIFGELDSKISKELLKAHSLLSDPTTHLEIVPDESLVNEAATIRFQLGKTSYINRDTYETLLHNQIKEDKELIKKKLRHMEINSTEDLIYIAASVKVIRKIISGIYAKYNIKECKDEQK